jgi:alkylation response protein AidB-like acyl-CoA dehydrogenase/putative sterol carrier protein
MKKSPWFSEDHQLFRQSIRQYIDQQIRPHLDQWEEDHRIPQSVQEEMGELGYLGLIHPENYGGSDADFWYSAVFLEELGRSANAGYTAAVSVHSYMAIAHISKVGSEHLKEKYLRPAIAGKKWGALGVTEPGAGSDVAAIRTTARREGNEYIINGSKTFITNGGYGDFVTLACKTKPDQGSSGISLIVVDLDSPGVTRSVLNKLGWNSSDTAEIAFDEVRVPAENLVGQENQGFYYIMDSFQLERLVAALLAIGGAHRAMELTLQYMDEREAFGRKINRFQALRHRLADLATELDAASQYTYYCSWLYENEQFAVKECSMAKLLTSELGKKIADECLQCFGGYGYMEEYPMARMFRDARAGTIVGGSSEIMREIIAKMIFDGTEYESAYETETEALPSARELILSLPSRLREAKINGQTGIWHFDLSGDSGGKFSVRLQDAQVFVEEGLQGEADCLIESSAETYEQVELGRMDAQQALMQGAIKVSDLGAMMRFSPLFRRYKSKS